MRFLVDAQLPPALARWLAERGHIAEHVMDHQLEAASDQQIWDFAFAAGAVIITKDADFAQRRALAETGPSVIWLRKPNSRRGELLDWFERALPEILAALARGDTLVEVV